MAANGITLEQLYNGFRDPDTIKMLLAKIAQIAPQLPEPLRIMEVCGGHTHSIMKFGLHQLLPDNIDFVHGPGCPVCIMPKERIDQAIALAQQPDVILATLGDMIRVPGSDTSLAKLRAQGADIRALYDPLDALVLAQQNPDKTVVFFAIGFETTTPMSAVLVQQAEAMELDNLLLHVNHVLVPPAIDAVMAGGEATINAFIGPSHVSVITGAKIYQAAVDNYQTPLVVTGFEPVDILEGVLMLVQQAIAGEAKLEIQYRRSVSHDGNLKAQQLVADYFELADAFRWRGLGDIPASALRLKPQFNHRNAELKYAQILPTDPVDDHKACMCGEILKGIKTPQQCKVFGRGCTPQTPMGSCMVSSEGACHAHYKYAGVSL
ncbi:hydrogenase formation protein HypD [Ferrimonas lipolytica]|uniref:Hydrogenase maturation factor n=1 Tax=Ferrimonas lipolytica TaxID=2724191 RepID=A0A6H1UI10_9GAMM|nr:hydrogenase formation protein HypD [Ferrimonas lipolytica]QIZ78721.1 hydrogenase formation protein HypD [Ferrimonas lipolytica]